MFKVSAKNFFLYVGMSIAYQAISGVLHFFLNFFVFWTMYQRYYLSMGITLAVVLLLYGILSYADGMNYTAKQKFVIKKQLLGESLGTAAYALCSLLLIFLPSGIQNIVMTGFYLGGFFGNLLIQHGFAIGSSALSVLFLVTLIEVPIFFAIRVVCLLFGRRHMIKLRPSLEDFQGYEELPKYEEEAPKKSWKDSIKIE